MGIKQPMAVWIIAGLLLAPAWVYGQRTETREADTDVASLRADEDAARADIEQVQTGIVERTNAFRKSQGLEAVKPNADLNEAAEYFAQYMARTNRYGHTADGSQPSGRAEKHGYDFCLVSENIAYQFNSAGFQTEELAKSFTQGWIESPGHRKNMVDSDVVDIGVAVARSEGGTYYAVQMFGRPKSMQIEFQVTNESQSAVSYTVGDRTFPLPPRVTRTHSRCRPVQLQIQWPEGGGPRGNTTQPNQRQNEESAEKGIRINSGTKYVIRAGPAGHLSVQPQKMEP